MNATVELCPECGGNMSAGSHTCGFIAGKGKKNKCPDMIIMVCEYCEEEFVIPQWRVNQGRGRFCSKECKDQFLTTVRGSDHIKYRGGRQIPGGYSGTNWKNARAAVLERAGGNCEWCGKILKPRNFVVHHIIGCQEFEDPDDGHTRDNMTAICKSCHAKYHKLGTIPKKGGDVSG